MRNICWTFDVLQSLTALSLTIDSSVKHIGLVSEQLLVVSVRSRSVVPLSKKLFPNFLVLDGSRYGFESDAKSYINSFTGDKNRFV